MSANKPKNQEILKCIKCAYAVWPQHALGHCIIHDIGTMDARADATRCGPDGKSFMARVGEPEEMAENSQK